MTTKPHATTSADGIVTITMIADDADVRMLNRYFNDRITRMMREPGLVAPIGPPLNDTAIPGAGRLRPHEAKLSAAGAERFRVASRSVLEANRLELTPEETAGLMLALWRSTYAPVLPGVGEKHYGRAIKRFAFYKAHTLEQAGNKKAAVRIREMGETLRIVHDEVARREKIIASDLDRIFTRSIRPQALKLE